MGKIIILLVLLSTSLSSYAKVLSCNSYSEDKGVGQIFFNAFIYSGSHYLTAEEACGLGEEFAGILPTKDSISSCVETFTVDKGVESLSSGDLDKYAKAVITLRAACVNGVILASEDADGKSK